MNKMIDVLFNICYLEELSRRDAWINRINPVAKLVVTLAFIVSVASVGKYDLESALLYGIYPIILLTVGEIPLKPLLQKMLAPIMAASGFGIFNPFFDQNIMYIAGTIHISAGWISLLTLLIKSLITILAALILVATTKIEEISIALTQLRVPKFMAMQFLLMFRYLTVLVNEVDRTITAYSMRSGGKRAIAYKVWGSLIGQIFMSASERSVRLYEAMKLRGFEGSVICTSKRKLFLADGIYIAIWMSVFGVIMGMRTI